MPRAGHEGVTVVDRRHAAEKLVVEGVVTQAGCVLEAGDEGSVWKWRPAQQAGEEGELVWLQALYMARARGGPTWKQKFKSSTSRFDS